MIADIPGMTWLHAACAAIYAALAVKSGCPLVTADRKLYDILRGSNLADHVLWIGEL